MMPRLEAPCITYMDGGINFYSLDWNLATIPNAPKTWFIVKQEHFALANEIFANLGAQITVDERRHLGAVLGKNSLAETYVRNKVQEPDCLQLHPAKCNLPMQL